MERKDHDETDTDLDVSLVRCRSSRSLVEGSDPGRRPSFYTFNANSAVNLRDGESVEIAGGPDLRAIVAKLRVLRD